jgi:hypothetical protein
VPVLTLEDYCPVNAVLFSRYNETFDVSLGDYQRGALHAFLFVLRVVGFVELPLHGALLASKVFSRLPWSGALLRNWLRGFFLNVAHADRADAFDRDVRIQAVVNHHNWNRSDRNSGGCRSASRACP